MESSTQSGQSLVEMIFVLFIFMSLLGAFELAISNYQKNVRPYFFIKENWRNHDAKNFWKEHRTFKEGR